MKEALICIVLLLLVFGFDNYRPYTLIWHQGLALEWSDFRGPRERDTEVDAVTSCGIKCAPSFTREKDIRFEVSCYFNARESWVNRRDANDYLLAHEQGHFDIGEIYARKLRYRLAKHTFDHENINAQVQRIYDEVFDDYTYAQKLYDRQTEHSIDKHKQEEWDGWINRQLERYRGFSNRYVTAQVDW